MKKQKRDWSWEEATDDEFKKRCRSATYYKIFKLSGTRRFPRKDALYKFWAKSRAEALQVLKAYAEDHPGATYYYASSGYYIDPDGSRHDDLHSEFLRTKRDRKLIRERHQKFLSEKKRVFGILKAALDGLKTKDRSLRFMIDDVRYFLKNYNLLHGFSHQRTEGYSLDAAILELLTFNLPNYLKPTALGAPNEYCEKARKLLKIPPFKDSYVPDNVMAKARELWQAEIAKLYEYVMVYRYYEGFGIHDSKSKAECAIHEKYKHTIPYHPGTYREIDYRKLRKLTDRYWRLWISQYQRIGRGLWI